MIYTLLKDELSTEGGIHALQLKTQTVAEREKMEAREKEEQGQQIAEIEKG